LKEKDEDMDNLILTSVQTIELNELLNVNKIVDLYNEIDGIELLKLFVIYFLHALEDENINMEFEIQMESACANNGCTVASWLSSGMLIYIQILTYIYIYIYICVIYIYIINL
jgi:hypothetical protein